MELNIQQTSLNVLMQMSLQEKIQLLFQRAKIIIDTYRSKVQELKRIGKIVGTTSKPDVDRFLSPSFRNKKHFKIGDQFEKSEQATGRPS